MARALDLARAAADAGEVPVGAILVSDAGELLGEGHNQPIAMHDATAHAEIIALRNALRHVGNYRLPPGASLYVTLEPCAMCAGAISHARVGRLVYGADDPKGGAVAHGPQLFTQSTVHHRPSEIVSGCLAEEAATLLKAFFKARRG